MVMSEWKLQYPIMASVFALIISVFYFYNKMVIILLLHINPTNIRGDALSIRDVLLWQWSQRCCMSLPEEL